jgi:alpha-L-rhamnosidase
MIAADSPFSAPLLRKQVSVADGHGPVVSATLTVTALGLVEAYVGGMLVSDEVLSPGWSAYEWRLRYRTHNVIHLVPAPGDEVVVGLALGRGWAVGRLGWTGRSALYSDEPTGMADLRIEFADGHVQNIVTDSTWAAGASAVTANDLYDGETVDARMMGDAWLQPDAVLIGWTGVHVVEFDQGRLVPYSSPVVRRQETLSPVSISRRQSGRTIIDFGQNLVGWLRLRARGERGSVITVRHAEVLEDGELCVRPLRSAQATDRFVLSGDDDEFEPTFTVHGFRYAEISGYPGDVSADDLDAIVVHTDLERIGTFECSDPLVNQLHHNAVWSFKGNLVDVPTDCPQRDERLGWTGDLAVAVPTAAFLFDVGAFLDSWMADLAAEQSAARGRVPLVVPDILKMIGVPESFHPVESAAIWSDAAAWVPWALWEAYGDRDRLARHFPAMLSHVRHVSGLLSAAGLWDGSTQLGDWLDPDSPPEDPAAAKANPGVVATAAFFRSVQMTAMAARELGESEAATELDALASRVRSAFQTNYVDSVGCILSDCQTVYALAISFGLLDAEQQISAGTRLAGHVAAAGYRISTGFAGTPYVLDALTATGHVNSAYRMLLQPESPGWAYQVRMGATTMWERWDSLLPDGSVNPGAMVGFNHCWLGSVADWLHRVVVGISPGAPGYSKVVVAPQPGGDLTWARGSLHTPHGPVTVAWSLEDEQRLTIEVTVPEGVEALVRMPGATEMRLPGGSGVFRSS